MLTIRELIKTLNNAFNQKLKKHRGNWEQNDPTADDYIRNRPFYTDSSTKVVIVPEQKVTMTDGPFAELVLPELIEFIIGQVYEVEWDGTNYVCTAFDIEGVGGIGNPNIMPGNTTGEPFLIAISKSEGYGMVLGNSVGTHTVSVKGDKIVKLDKKYLPDLGLADVAYSGSYYDLYDTPTIYSDVVRYGTTQSLSTTQKTTAKTNIGAVGYDVQTLTDAQKTQARANIGAVSSEDITGVVKYSTEQSLTDEQKSVARDNIGAADEVKVEELITSAKESILLTDGVNGYKYIVCMRDGNLVTYCAVNSIEVTTMPTKVEYMAGEYFDPTGMIVTTTTYDGVTKEITDFSYSSTYITESTTAVEITYVECGIIHTTTVPVTVVPFDAATVLVDYEYTDNGDGTYTLTGWKGTHNGEASTEIIIPNNGLIIV